ncbi:MAG TPA: tetratricopeptide repeat protein [Candidatus Deferrimicrobium sp.]|nr:tetratricopeptide repeat protein [Candidatus Deferrimicrobium sp.]
MKKIVYAALVAGLMAACGGEPTGVKELTKAGERAFFSEDYAQARKYFSQAVARTPSDRKLLYLLGLSYQRDFLYDSAYQYLKRADLLFPNDREINLALLDISNALGQWQSAIRAIQVLVRTGDPLDRHLRELADLNTKIKNWAVAYKYTRDLLRIEPDNPSLYLQAANLAAQNDSPQVALQVIDSAIQLFGSRTEFSLNRGLYLASLERYAEAETLLRTLYAQDTTSQAVKLNLANVLASQSDRARKEEALRLYGELLPVVDTVLHLDSLIEQLRREIANYR